jgi:SAM-dependent methyltransferase
MNFLSRLLRKRTGSTNPDFKSAYADHVRNLEGKLSSDAALKEAVGGNFLAVGKLEYYLLRSLGLTDGQLVADIGCGSGRLACQLAPFSGIRYLGTDVVQSLLDHAAKLSAREDWRFVLTAGTEIPARDNKVDFVCFFSVFTHLLHEDTFRYFREAARVLKPGGLMVFSFLEFEVECHWQTFIDSVNRPDRGNHLNQFIDRNAIRAWAKHTGLELVRIEDGDKPNFPIAEPVVWDEGLRMEGNGNLGQSVAVLRKPSKDDGIDRPETRAAGSDN